MHWLQNHRSSIGNTDHERNKHYLGVGFIKISVTFRSVLPSGQCYPQVGVIFCTLTCAFPSFWLYGMALMKVHSLLKLRVLTDPTW